MTRMFGPGSTPEKPLVFVRSVELRHSVRPKYREIEGKYPGQLTICPGDIIYTDRVVRREALTSDARTKPCYYHNVYRARTRTGRHGFIMADDIISSRIFFVGLNINIG